MPLYRRMIPKAGIQFRWLPGNLQDPPLTPKILPKFRFQNDQNYENSTEVFGNIFSPCCFAWSSIIIEHEVVWPQNKITVLRWISHQTKLLNFISWFKSRMITTDCAAAYAHIQIWITEIFTWTFVKNRQKNIKLQSVPLRIVILNRLQ